MISYIFNDEMFKENFTAKEPCDNKPADSYRLTQVADVCFKLYPYKATRREAAPIVYELSEVISPLFRKALGIKTDTVEFDELCENVKNLVEIEEDDVEVFRDVIRDLFFNENCFCANNIGLYPYQNAIKNRSAEGIADFLYCVLGLDETDKLCIKDAEKNYPFNVLERLIVDSIKTSEDNSIGEQARYYQVKRSIQKQFKEDFRFMLSSGMTSVDDISNALAFYYFYYVSQTALTLDQFGNGSHSNLENVYFALDWEKVSKNRQCCIKGWDSLSFNVTRMFSHAITLEILNQNSNDMMDYIDFKMLADQSSEMDVELAKEIQRAEKVYTSYVGDCKKFNSVPEQTGANQTDSALRHLFECVSIQFNDTSRKRASQFYCEKFSEFCKNRFVKNRKKSGLVLNLTERDIIFLTKLALRNEEKIRLNELYKQYELRGVFLDTTSKSLLQEFFTKLNLIDKKSDSGDAQYVKRIL